LGTRAIIYVARPIYRKLFERPLWWFLAKVKDFFFAETSQRLVTIENRLAALQGLQDAFRQMEANNAAQWAAIEQLLLAMLRQPQSRIVSAEQTPISAYTPAALSRPEANLVNGPNIIR
jgi:hypothetical protein